MSRCLWRWRKIIFPPAYLAGQQSAIDYPVLYKTVNGGTNWQSVLLITNNQNVFHRLGGGRLWRGPRLVLRCGRALGLAVAPNDSSKVIYTDLGFAHLSTNGGAFWKQIYVNPRRPESDQRADAHRPRPIAVSTWKTPPAG